MASLNILIDPDQRERKESIDQMHVNVDDDSAVRYWARTSSISEDAGVGDHVYAVRKKLNETGP